MSRLSRRLALTTSALLAAVSGTGVAGAATAATPDVAPGSQADTRTVRYGSVSLQVPAAWPVVRLDGTDQCVRTDRNAIYLGAAPAQQNCPAHLVGRADTIWLRPGDKVPAGAAPARVGALAMTTTKRDASAGLTAVATDRNVTVEATWRTDSATVDAALATLRTDTTTKAPPRTAATGGATAKAAPTAAPEVAPTGAPFTGMGMDTCAAPSAATMNAWGASPYRAVGIYIGGSMRACPDGNLNSTWINTVSRAGWGVIPIYVGIQAPCVQQKNLALIDPTKAGAQGVAAAQDAIAKANKFGLPAGSPLYFDMEHYVGDAACTNAVLDFLTAWTQTLHTAGFRSGAYGNSNSLMRDLSVAISTNRPNYVAPDQIWYAQWDYKQTLDGSRYVPEFKNDYWANHQRMKQYSGGVTETWGGVSMNVDQNWIDSYLPGNATNVDYGAMATGPGGAGFLFTGPMTSWRPMPGVGVTGRAYWTGATASTQEVNGATWTAPNQSAGAYQAKVFIPATATASTGYQVTDATGTRTVVVDQGANAGKWVTLGTFTAGSTQPIVVHVGDKDAAGSTSSRIVVDALQLDPVGPPTAAVTGLKAVAGDASATVSWIEPGGPVQSYRVVAQPSGKTVTVPVTGAPAVPGSTKSATVTGLANHQASTFSVTPMNSAGAGPATVSGAVVPEGKVGLNAVTPTRMLDTRTGTGVDKRKGAIPAGGSIRVRATGITGSPVPVGATAVVVNLISPNPAVSGWIGVPGVDPNGATSTQVVARRTTDSNVTLPIDANGYVTLVNHSGAAQHVILDAQGYLAAGGSGWTTTDPLRLGDTRFGAPGSSVTGAIPAKGTRTFQIAGRGGVPAGTRAVHISLMALDPTSTGYLSLGDGTSVMNYAKDPYSSSGATAILAADGSLTVRNTSAGSIHVVLDVRGYNTSAAPSLTTVGAVRVHDTRFTGKVAAWGSVQVPVSGLNVPGASGARTAFVLVTSLAPKARGGLAVAAAPNTALLIASEPGISRSMVIPVPIAADGTVSVSNRTAQAADLLVDVVGFGS